MVYKQLARSEKSFYPHIIFPALLFLLSGLIYAQDHHPYARIISDKPGEYVISFDFPDPVIETSGTGNESGSIITVKGLPVTGNPSLPPLPFAHYLLELPEGPSTLTVIKRDVTYRTISRILPSQDKTVQDSGQIIESSEPAAWQTAGHWLPADFAQLKNSGKFRDIPLRLLTIYPCRYLATQQKLEIIRHITVRINYSADQKIKITEPISGDVDEFLKRGLLNYTSSKKNRLWEPKSSVKAVRKENTLSNFQSVLPPYYIKLTVDRDGIYKITRQDLQQKAPGLNLQNIDPRTFRLFSGGIQIPIYVQGESDGSFDAGDYFEFYGEQYRARLNPYLSGINPVNGHYIDPWSDDNVYFLFWGAEPGLRLIEENGGITQDTALIRPPFFSVRKHFEEDNTGLDIKDINLIQPAANEDIWAFDGGITYIASGQNTQSTKEYSFTVERPDFSFQRTDTLRINFQGISTGIHYVQVFVNDVLLTPTPVTWTGPEKKQADIPIPPGSGALNNGTNRLRIYTPPTSDRNLDMLALNWFEISYRRAYQADEEGSITFNGGPDILPALKHQFEIRDFKTNTISVYKKGISKMTSWDIDSSTFGRSYKITFQDFVYSGDIEYIAVEERAKRKPKSILLDTLANLTSVNHDARYLVIAPKVFHGSLRRLTDHRRNNGLTTEIVDIEDIYDQFGFGVKSPYAIRDFLRYTQQSPYWQGSHGPPLYVLLAGDGSSRPKKSLNEIIPVQMIQTMKFGPAASDTWYAQMSDNDIVADLFIGRFPVTTINQLEAVIDKTIRYEQSAATGSWKNRMTFIGGSQETRGIGLISDIPTDVFRFQSSRIINQTLPPRFTYDRIYAYPGKDKFFGGANQVIQAFSEGKLLVSYLGHGGGGIWGDLDVITGKPLLNDNQVQSFTANPGRWPVVLSMTCFVGAFDNDGRALGEVLLNTADKGAIGVYAASGVGWIRGDYQLLDQTLPAILAPNTSVGSAIAQGKLNYLILNGQEDFNTNDPFSGTLGATLVAPSMVFQFNYLGDPAVRLKTPGEHTCSVSQLTPLRSDSITVYGQSPFQNGNGTLELYQLRPVRDSVAYGGNIESFETVYAVPFAVSGGQYSIGVNLSLIHDTLLSNGFTGIRLYAESASGQEYFNAHQSVQIEGTYLAEVQTVPSVLTSSDTFRIRVKASDPQGIRYVIARHERIGTVNIPGLTDTLAAIGNDYYLSTPIGPYNETDQIRYRIVVVDEEGDSTVSARRYDNSVLAGIDLSIGAVPNPGNPQSGRIYLAGTDQVRLYANVENLGVRAVPGISVKFFRGDPRTTGYFLGEDTVSLAGSVPNAGQYARDTASIICTLGNGTHPVYVWIDSARVFSDINRINNLGYNSILINSFSVTPDLGTTLSFIRNDTVAIDNGLSASIPPQAVNQPSVLRITRITAPSIVGQPDLQFAQIRGVSGNAAYRLECGQFASVFQNQKALHISFAYDTAQYPAAQGYRDSLGVYAWDSGNKRWRLIGYDTGFLNGEIRVAVNNLVEAGLLTLMINRDRTAPIIEPNVEGQYFSQGAIVSRNPKISAILYDRNGVSLNKNDFSVEIDGTPLPADRLILPDSVPNSSNVALSLNLQQTFEAGLHTVVFRAKDVNGNESGPVELTFNVVTQFKIRLIGNFPNPFSNTTTIAYRIEAPENLDRLTISVYTVSGRLVRRYTSDDPVSGPPLNAIGYHELIWDATDDDGHGVANGIYFYLIKGKLKGKTVEHRGKIAYFR